MLEIPRSGLKALLHNQDAEFEDATFLSDVKARRSFLFSHVSSIGGMFGYRGDTRKLQERQKEVGTLPNR